ncbi:unnamed protein product [Closterium sp. NIES-64]|nr:unnamed protein product [Closterium sp. NIES-64]
MYAFPTSADRAGHLCVPPDPGAAAALGASESASSGAGGSPLSGTALDPASHTFTLDSGASRSFFRDRTTLTPLGRPVAVSLEDPSGGPVLAHFSTVLSCPAAPSSTLSGLYLPSFNTNLVSGADLQDAGVHQFTRASQRVTHCTDAQTGPHLATFTRWPGSSLYTLITASPPVPASGQVAASGQVFAAASRSSPERQRAAPHSSQFPPTEAPLQTLHMDVWGPARVRGQGHERYFLLVVDDYSRYTTVFSLRSKGDVTETFTLPDSPQQNGIAERRIGMVMDIARTSMMHAAAPHFLWPFAVRYAAHQINLHPRVSRPETSPALLWTGKVGDASAFRVWGSRAFVRDLSADKLLLASSWVDAVEPVEVAGDSGAAEGAEPGGADSGGAGRVGTTTRGAEPGGAKSRGAESGRDTPGGAVPGGTEPGGATLGGAEREGAERARGASGGAEPIGAAGTGGSAAAVSAGAARPGGARTRSTGAAGPAGTSEAGAASGAGAEATAVGPGGGLAEGATGTVGGTGAGGAAGVGAAAGGTGAVPAVSGVAAWPRPYFVPLLQQVLGLPPSTCPPPPLECPQPVPSQLQLQPASPLRAPSPYTGPTGGLAERREPASRPALPVRAARTKGRGSRQRPPPVPGTHRMSLRPSTAPLRAALPSPPESFLPALANPESDSLRAASPTVTRLLVTVVTDPSFESIAASALVAELVDFAARCRLDYAASLDAESESVCPPSVGGECALGTDVLEDRQEEFQCLAAMDAEMASWKSRGTYVDAVPPPGANIVSGMWIFRVKRQPGSPPVFKARYLARGFIQRHRVDNFQTFSPTPKMTTLQVQLHVAAHGDYELHFLNFSTSFLQGSLHEEIGCATHLASLGRSLLVPSGASGVQFTVFARRHVSGTTL